MRFFRIYTDKSDKLLGGLIDTKLLEIRVFDEAVKRSVYAECRTNKKSRKRM